MTQLTETLAKDWDELVGPIANDLESSAKQYGALSRHRGFHSATDLLRAILIYAIALSLSATALWGAGLKLYNISRQALHRQVLKSTPWLHHLLGTLLRTLVSVPPAGTGLIHRLVLRDASTISRPGSPGTEWRLHLSWCPFQQQPAQVTLTDAHTGESFEDAALQAGDLVLADRAYGIWRTIRLALDSLAFFIVRLTWSNLPLCTPEGQPFNLIAWLRLLPETQTTAEITVVAADDPLQRPLRLVAGRLPAPQAEAARAEVKHQARQDKRTVNPNTLLAAGFCLLLTNLPAATWSVGMVLVCYRVRWQIEWCFRRWKDLCHLDELPAYPAQTAEPVLLAKLILIVLMQARLGCLPWDEWWTGEEPAPVVSAVVSMVYNHLCEIIRPTAVVLQLLADPVPFLRHLRSSRRKRSLQLADATRRLAGLLTGLVPIADTG